MISKNMVTIIVMICIVIGFISIFLYRKASLEINKRKRMEEKITSISDRLQAVINASPLPISIIDAEGKVLQWNPAAEQVFGWSELEVISRPLPIIPEDRQEEALEFRRNIFEGRSMKTVETVRLRKDGTQINVALSASPLLDTRGKVIAAIGIYEDITERRKAEEDVRFLASIIQNLPDAVCAIDPAGNTIVWNKGAEAMLGYKAEEIIGKPITDVIPEEIAQREFSHCLTTLNAYGFFTGYESVRLAKDGRKVPVELTAVAIRDSAQRIKNYASIMLDLTDRKKAEEQRMRSHTLESIGILAGGIAHDFNNLLSIILGDIHVAKTAVQPNDKAFKRLSDAEQVCEKASELSKRLITFATGGEPLRKTTSIADVITETAPAMLRHSPATLSIELPSDLHAVAIDEGQMKQVINNLVLNAIEAMPDGGNLSVRGRNVHITAKDSLPLPEGEYVKISFQDTGAGIPAEIIPKIFEPYFSTKDSYNQKGLGLGLAVCYSVLKRHDGLITVESEVGKGSTFHIYLPAGAK
jgi:PAS domain S-box-containing protein